MQRVIAHLDMDAFFASVEQRDDPSLAGLPVIIGRDPRGVVSAASYEARVFGVRSAMPVVQARKLCPRGVFLPGRMRRYVEVSHAVMDILRDMAPVVEQASVDEAYLDLTGTRRLLGPPGDWALGVKARIRERLGLGCSIGVAPLKFLAKIASDMQKPDGLTVIEPGEVQETLARLPVGKIPGVGGRTLETLRRLGVVAAGDMTAYPEEFWLRHLGRHGLELLAKARGIDDSPVSPGGPRKSVGAENTFSRDVSDRDVLRQWLLVQSERLGRELRRLGRAGRTVTLKLKFADFTRISRARTLPEPVDLDEVLFETACALLEEQTLVKKVRLIGLSVSRFGRAERRLSLFEEPGGPDPARIRRLDQAIDAVRDKFGRAALTRGRVFGFKTRREE